MSGNDQESDMESLGSAGSEGDKYDDDQESDMESLSPAASYSSYSSDYYSDSVLLNNCEKYASSSSDNETTEKEDYYYGVSENNDDDDNEDDNNGDNAPVDVVIKNRPAGLPRIFRFPPKNYGAYEINWNQETDGASPSNVSDEEDQSDVGQKGLDLECRICKSSENLYWSECTSDCFRKRGTIGEKQLSPFLRHTMAERKRNLR
jgi:hypothetical protein